MADGIQALSFLNNLQNQKYARAERARSERIALQQWTFGQLTDQWNNATGAQREHIADSMKSLFSVTEPAIQMALMPYLKGGPLDPIQQRLDQYDKMFPMPKINASPEEEPNIYAQQMFAQMDARRMRKHFATGVKDETQNTLFFTSNKENMVASRGTSGTITLYNYEDSELRKIADEHNMTLGALKAAGGWIYGAGRMFTSGDKAYLIRSGRNVITGGYNFTKNEMPFKYEPPGGAGGKKPTFKFPRTIPDDLEKFRQAWVTDDKENLDLQRVKTIRKRWMAQYEEEAGMWRTKEEKEAGLPKATAGADIEVQKYLQSRWPGWSFILKDKGAIKDPWYWSPSYAEGPNKDLIAVPGVPTEMTMPNGKTITIYFDKANDMVYNASGIPLGTSREFLAEMEARGKK